MFCEPSPGPVKYAASLLGMSSDEVRLPMMAATDSGREKVKAAMHSAGLI
jgi:4-hydroxy-tetrahydrodipicolinate synthase